MVGSLNCLQEAKASTNYFDISFSTPVDCKEKEEGVWLYVEQNTSKKPSAPELQKIYHLAKPKKNKYISNTANTSLFENMDASCLIQTISFGVDICPCFFKRSEKLNEE